MAGGPRGRRRVLVIAVARSARNTPRPSDNNGNDDDNDDDVGSGERENAVPREKLLFSRGPRVSITGTFNYPRSRSASGIGEAALIGHATN